MNAFEDRPELTLVRAKGPREGHRPSPHEDSGASFQKISVSAWAIRRSERTGNPCASPYFCCSFPSGPIQAQIPVRERLFHCFNISGAVEHKSKMQTGIFVVPARGAGGQDRGC